MPQNRKRKEITFTCVKVMIMKMFIPGLVSVTYRPMTPAQIISAAREAGLSAIEWGGDIHVPHGDTGRAAVTGGMTRGAGLMPISYGTYYYTGTYGDDYMHKFRKCLECADILGAPNLRLWAGKKNSEDVGADERAAMVTELRACARAAAGRGKTISFEYHGNSLTNRAPSAVRLIEEIAEPNVSLYWQPNQFVSFEQNIENLKLVLPYVSNVHVFAWLGRDRFLLSEHADMWHAYMDILASTGREHGMLLEFVPGDDSAKLPTEAATLLSWIGSHS